VNVLGFDTATAATSACVRRADGEVFERVPSAERLADPPGHARELMPAVASVLDESGLELSELDAIAVGVGPGSFTGLRIGVSTARGLARSADVELRPVSSLAALAAGIPAAWKLPVLDAKRGEVFAALYEESEPVWDPLVARPEELAARAAESGKAPLASGDGSLRFQGVLEAAGIRVEPEASRAHVVRALHVCRLGAAAPAAPPDAVVPDYLRLPDAKPSP
jgi:tRNA threonylcarbamoyladenosine biosynthesis protein TsaB